MLKDTIRNDLFPLRKVDQGGCTQGGAPFTISREFSCYVDYLGSLFTGWAEWNRSSDRFGAYLREVLGRVNPHYARHAGLIREMYRNGPIHEFDPKEIFNRNGDQCWWLTSVGESPGFHDFGSDYKIEIRHLEIVGHPSKDHCFYLPVFTSQLLEELIESIELFKQGVGNPLARVLCWNRAVGLLIHPVRFDSFVPHQELNQRTVPNESEAQ